MHSAFVRGPTKAPVWQATLDVKIFDNWGPRASGTTIAMGGMHGVRCCSECASVLKSRLHHRHARRLALLAGAIEVHKLRLT
jgi:hypothetical protein